jgi:hypothetical protein
MGDVNTFPVGNFRLDQAVFRTFIDGQFAIGSVGNIFPIDISTFQTVLFKKIILGLIDDVRKNGQWEGLYQHDQCHQD